MSCILKNSHYWDINKITQDEYYTQRIYDLTEGIPMISEAKALFIQLQKRESPEVAKKRIERTFYANAQGFMKRDSMIKAIQLIGSYNNIAGLHILKIQKFPSGDFFVRIDQNEAKKRQERPLIKKIFKDPETQTQDQRSFNKLSTEPIKLRKSTGEDYNPSKKGSNLMLATEFQEQIQQLTSRFKSKGFDVKVIVDGDLPSGISGQLLGTADPKYKALVANGTIYKGEAVIVVNPRELFADTVIHEFSHLYIDLLGGLSDPTVALAVAQLRNTELWGEVEALYSDLSPDALAKEVLATAMGREGVDIFRNPQKESRFMRLLDLIFEKIRKILGLRRDAVRSLAMDMIQGDMNIEGDMSAVTQDRRTVDPKNVRKGYKGLKTEEEIFNKFKDETIQLLNRKKATLQDRINKVNKDYAPGTHDYLTGFKESVDDIIDSVNNLAVVSILSRINVIINSNTAYLNTIRKKKEFGDPEISRGSSAISELSTVDETLISLQEILENVRYAVNASMEAAAKEKRSSPMYEALTSPTNTISIHLLMEKILDARGLRDEMRNEVIAKMLVYNSDSKPAGIRLREREKFIRENIKKYPKRKDLEEAATAHVNEYMEENAKDVQEEAMNWAYALLDMGVVDMGSMEKIMLDPASFKDPLISLVVKEIEKAEYNIRRTHLEHLGKIEKIEAKIREVYGNNLGKDNALLPLYENAVDATGKPTGKKTFMLVSEYYSTPFLHLESLKKTMGLAALNDPTGASTELEKAKKEYEDYLKENFDVKRDVDGDIESMLVKDKWRNPAHSSLSTQEKELLNEIKDLFDLTDTFKPPTARIRKTFAKKTGGAGIVDVRHSAFKSKTADKEVVKEGIGFYVMPSVRRGILQGMLAVGPKEAIKAALSDLGGKSAEDELAYSYAKQNEAGEFVKDVPIYFRGEIEDEQRSRNITHLMNLELWSSLNYREKARIEPFMALMDEVISERRVAKLDGVTTKAVYDALIRKLNRDRSATNQLPDEQQTISGAESIIYEAFVRIVDDRIYGQHRLGNQKAHKIVDAVNSWVSKTNLAWNPFSGAVQFTQGNLMNYLTAKHSKFIDSDTLLRSQFQYLTRGMSSMLADHGLVRSRSYDGRLMERFNVFQNFSPFAFDFNKAFRLEDTPGAVSAVTQHPVEVELSYTLAMSVMKSRKLRNKDGKYIKELGVNGSPSVLTDKRSEALGLDAAYVNSKDSLTTHPDVYNTDLNDKPLEQQEFDIERIIHNLQRDAHGNFGTDNREEYKTNFFLRLIMNMRGWIPRTVNKRFKGIDKVTYAAFRDKSFTELIDEGVIQYDDKLQEFSEGVYVSGFRFVKDVIKMWKTASMKEALSTTFAIMTPEQQKNLVMLRNEMLFIMGLFALTMLLAANIDPDDDDDEAKMFAAYVLSRVKSEMMFYINPLTTIEILRTPMASLSMFEKVEKFAFQLAGDAWNLEFQTYDRGTRKSKTKIVEYGKDLVPMFNSSNANISEYYNYQVGLTSEDF